MHSLQPACAALLAAAATAPAVAAEYYWVPSMELSAEHHTNVDLQNIGDRYSASNGYIGDLQLLLGARTPTWDTLVRPRVLYEYYTDDAHTRSTDEFLDFKTHHNGLRDMFDMYGKYSHQSTFSSELAPAQFDNFDPNNPTVIGSGLLNVNNTQNLLQLRPTFEYSLSKLLALGVSENYQRVRYDSTIPGTEQDYDYTFTRAYLRETFTQKTDVLFGPYFSTYDSKANGEKTTSSKLYGFEADLNHSFTQTFRGYLSLQAQRGATDTFGTNPASDTNTSWSFLGNLVWVGETSHVRAYAGRSISPSGRGVINTADQFRIQYDRQLTTYVSISGAYRFVYEKAVGDLTAQDRQEYNRLTTQVNWDITRNWYLFGGYNYTSQIISPTPMAHDHSFQIGVGYFGNGPGKLLRLQ